MIGNRFSRAIKVRIAAVFALFVVTTALLVSACSMHGVGQRGLMPPGQADLTGATAVSGSASQKPSDFVLSHPITTKTYREIAQYQPPEGVDSNLFATLKDRLVAELRKVKAERQASKAPPGWSGRVQGIGYDSSSGLLKWQYLNTGDYDLDGEVGVSDITPIAKYYGKIGGNGDPYVDWMISSSAQFGPTTDIGVAYITNIARNFGNRVAGYKVFRASRSDWSVSEVATVAVSDIAGGMPPGFEVPVPFDDVTAYSVQAFDVDDTVSANSGYFSEGWKMLRLPWDFGYASGFAFANIAGVLGAAFIDSKSGSINFSSYLSDSDSWTEDHYVYSNSDKYGPLIVRDIGGQPGIAAVNYTRQSILYFHKDSESYSGWSYAVTIANMADYSLGFDLADVAGSPAAIYYADGVRLAYVRSSDDSGDSFNAWSYITQGYTQGGDLEAVDGTPAVVCVNGNGLTYLRASDPGGSAWGSTLLAELWSGPIKFSFSVIAGIPMVAYENDDTNDIRFIRALDADGTSWAPEVVVTALPDYFEDMKLLSDMGMPTILITSQSGVTYSESLSVCRATDETGTGWEQPVKAENDSQKAYVMAGGDISADGFDNGIAFATSEDGGTIYVRGSIEVDSPPIVKISAEPASGRAPLNVQFKDNGTYDPGGAGLSYFEWFYSGDDGVEEQFYPYSSSYEGHAPASYTFSRKGPLHLRIVAHDYDSDTSESRLDISLDNGWEKVCGQDVNFGGRPTYVSSALRANIPFFFVLTSDEGTDPDAAVSVYRCVLVFRTATDSSASQWNDGVVLLDDIRGLWPLSMKAFVMDGKPACGVYEHVFKKLMMYVSDDDMGGSFTGPVDIAQLSGKPIQIDWATLDGVPAYSYISATGDRIYFASAKDKTGTMWNAPVVAAQGTSLHNLSLSGTGESFQIAYIDFGPGDTPNDRSLCFVRALNAAGSSWSAPIQIATGWNAGVECSLAAVEGNPAVAFHTEFLKSSNDDLYYIRALDQMGQLWGTPVLVDKPSASGWTPELSVVAGKPVISFIASAYYSNPEGGGAMYLAARDAAGVEWEEPYSVASAAGSDRISISNIMDVDGSPAVAVSRLLYTRDNYYTLNSSWNTEFLIWRD